MTAAMNGIQQDPSYTGIRGNVIPIDIMMDPVFHDLTSVAGFVTAFTQIRRAAPGSLAPFGGYKVLRRRYLIGSFWS